ncbi:MAG: KpsF/GutQ family sugar-phosphate isomerase [Deltaproteobacteria bacterium]|nr:KpsF/GutQ family sugar-phosphate isomerase [Deltaproteobacteria bacterium]
MSSVLKTAREVLAIEAEGIIRLQERLNGNFEQAVDMILAASGKVIATGIGKSGIVARKIMATLNSTGTTAIYLHPVEALHGDLGMVHPGDVVIALSHSGHTQEMVMLVPHFKDHGAQVVAFTGGLDSPLARASDLVVDCGVEREACPLGLAPTASTTAALAMGDALAVVLMEKRAFKAEDFRHHHPGGNLGQRLSLTVDEVMPPLEEVPSVRPSASAEEAIRAIDAGGLGTVLITSRGRLLGIFTDGDLRRAVVSGRPLGQTPVKELMTANPLTIPSGTLAADALHLMEEKLITALPVLDRQGRLKGLVHLHDVLGRGTVSLKHFDPCGESA